MMLGASGTYSSVALMNPRLMLAFYDACEQGAWEPAARLQRDLVKFFVEAVQPLLDEGYWDAAIDKALAAATGFLSCPARVRKPYAQVPPDRIASLREYLQQNFPAVLTV